MPAEMVFQAVSICAAIACRFVVKSPSPPLTAVARLAKPSFVFKPSQAVMTTVDRSASVLLKIRLNRRPAASDRGADAAHRGLTLVFTLVQAEPQCP